jgi:hypothetical protein
MSAFLEYLPADAYALAISRSFRPSLCKVAAAVSENLRRWTRGTVVLPKSTRLPNSGLIFPNSNRLFSNWGAL